MYMYQVMTWRKRCSPSGGGWYVVKGFQRRSSVVRIVHGTRIVYVVMIWILSDRLRGGIGLGSGTESILRVTWLE